MLNLTNEVFGKLTVIEPGEPVYLKSGRKRLTWLCQCECGNKTIVTASNLKCKTKSCGCLTGGNNSHGQSKTRLYSIFTGMKGRCYNPKNAAYRYYGNKGITVCDEWVNDSSKFLVWAEQYGYASDLSIERIDVTKGYSPSNCCWIPMEEQAVNKGKPVSNKSGYVGVNWHGASKKWTSAVRYKNKKNYLGLFTSALEAAKARNKFIVTNKLPHNLNSF